MIKRYAPYTKSIRIDNPDCFSDMRQRVDGDWVLYNDHTEQITELVEMLEDVIIWTNESIYHDEVIMEAQQLVDKYKNTEDGLGL